MDERYASAARLAAGMRRLGIDSALVGGLAVGVRCRPRTTKDIDFAVGTRSDAEAERVAAELATLGLVPRAILEQVETRRLATIRFALRKDPTRTPMVDVLFASCGIEVEIVDEGSPVPLPGGDCVRVATVPHLLAMKILSERADRPQDRIDLAQLLQLASARELRRAAAALELIAARGFARGKDLLAVLRALLHEFGRGDVAI